MPPINSSKWFTACAAFKNDGLLQIGVCLALIVAVLYSLGCDGIPEAEPRVSVACTIRATLEYADNGEKIPGTYVHFQGIKLNGIDDTQIDHSYAWAGYPTNGDGEARWTWTYNLGGGSFEYARMTVYIKSADSPDGQAVECKVLFHASDAPSAEKPCTLRVGRP